MVVSRRALASEGCQSGRLVLAAWLKRIDTCSQFLDKLERPKCRILALNRKQLCRLMPSLGIFSFKNGLQNAAAMIHNGRTRPAKHARKGRLCCAQYCQMSGVQLLIPCL